MARIELGTIVVNPRKPEWGPGKVVAVAATSVEVVFRDTPDLEPKRFEADALLPSDLQWDPILERIPIGGLPRARAGTRKGAGKVESAEARVAWLGPEAGVMLAAFRRVFGPAPQPFGDRSLGHGGLYDGNDGIQWNAAIYLEGGMPVARSVGVNLEGKAYDGWPIGRLIAREIGRPTLPEFVRTYEFASSTWMIWERDAWQAGIRVAIEEKALVDDTRLSNVTPGAWRGTLHLAQACLRRDEAGYHHAVQQVTFAASLAKGEREVSPHLMFRRYAPEPFEWEEFMWQARAALEPLYEWTARAAR